MQGHGQQIEDVLQYCSASGAFSWVGSRVCEGGGGETLEHWGACGCKMLASGRYLRIAQRSVPLVWSGLGWGGGPGDLGTLGACGCEMLASDRYLHIARRLGPLVWSGLGWVGDLETWGH